MNKAKIGIDMNLLTLIIFTNWSYLSGHVIQNLLIYCVHRVKFVRLYFFVGFFIIKVFFC